MARRLNLQEYQENILSKLKGLENTQGASTTSRLGVQIGDDAWLLSLSDVGEVLPIPEIYEVPLTRPWFLGMANVRGNLFAVSDLSAFFGGRPARLGGDSRLLLAGNRFGINAAFVIDRLYGLRNVADMQHKDKSKKAPAWQSGVFKDATTQEWRELDVAALLNNTSFMQVAA
jgi:twitching motility protein PilI